ncbi:haloacid dehalogenase type II [Aestuariivirga litoralis]|uniref:(S)-2-haloacid dehalogenase n=1 Tax=Aestuariivirga litoralis TaxID=2650924 RepID=A0A2W2AYK5_9HYPH|nr:haloacid dehalogenase type II [Aestuariivirga litoralis]PZF78852.1 haloacid dehalogenase type II [Aestuariivirga litoralis]
MEKLPGIRACVFDAYGTLFDVQGPMRKLAPEIGPHAEDISRLWRQKQLEYSWLRSLMGVHADFWHVTGDALDYALDQFGVSEPGLRDEIMALYLKLDAYEEVADALAAVKARSKLTAILSNGSPSMLDAAVRHAGLDKLFNMVLSVEDVGIYKPSRRVYRHAMQKLQIHEAAAICFVTSNTWDAHGAAQFGLQVVRVDRFGWKDDRLPGKPAALIPHLGKLAALV